MAGRNRSRWMVRIGKTRGERVSLAVWPAGGAGVEFRSAAGFEMSTVSLVMVPGWFTEIF